MVCLSFETIKAGQEIANRIDFDKMSESQLRSIVDELASRSTYHEWERLKLTVKKFFKRLFRIKK